MLSNMKSLKVRTDQIEIPDLQSINIQAFKPQDKKLLIDLFCNDEMVQQICTDILNRMRKDNVDLSNIDMLTYLNTDKQGQTSNIDPNGNVQRRAKSAYQVQKHVAAPQVVPEENSDYEQLAAIQRPNTSGHVRGFIGSNAQYGSSIDMMSNHPPPQMNNASLNHQLMSSMALNSGTGSNGLGQIPENIDPNFMRPKVSRLNSAVANPNRVVKTHRNRLMQRNNL